MSDQAEIIRDGQVMKTIPRLEVEAEKKPEPPHRHIADISGAIRERAEWICRMGERPSDSYQRMIEAGYLATRILRLLDELDATLLSDTLKRSVEGCERTGGAK